MSAGSGESSGQLKEEQKSQVNDSQHDIDSEININVNVPEVAEERKVAAAHMPMVAGSLSNQKLAG